MSNDAQCTTPDNKGKNRAAQDPTETTPLLASSSHSDLLAETPSSVARGNHRLRSKLLYVFLFSLSFTIIAAVSAALLAWSYAARVSSIPPEELVSKAVFFRYPSHIDVLRAEKGIVWLQVQGKLGVDAGSILGVRRNPEGDGFFTSVWKLLGQWGIRRVGKVTVHFSPIHVTPEYNLSLVLASVHIADLDVSLNPNPPSDKSWLSDVTVNLAVQPTSNTSDILQFMEDSWSRGQIDVRTNSDAVAIRGGGIYEQGWRKLLRFSLTKLRVPLHFKSALLILFLFGCLICRYPVPHLPGLPSPGGSFPSIGSLLTLQEFHVVSQDNTLSLDAQATFVNPAPLDLQVTIPSLPFIVSIPTPNESVVPIASVSSIPFTLTHPNITLHVSGTVLPLQPSSSGILSTFLTRYLSGKSNSISISTPLQPGLAISANFPAPTPRPELLRNVTIRDMKIKPKGTNFVASGIVFVQLALPKGMDVSLDVHRAFPDVLVFDGDVTETNGAPPDMPLPDPLPEHAFAHIRPDDWLPALCVREEAKDGDGASYAITAAITDVPLQILPGREGQFTNFVGKARVIVSFFRPHANNQLIRSFLDRKEPLQAYLDLSQL